ncbi:preprotein translocase subunit SecG [Mobilitalea sibirica]|uniref:Protein-export membrane protein SecG n=1 Tax=Mobilitalea sibirica TaxID=1462919 RepID=A0A8J7H8G9_9FIRM|nr:preprotein translocase subunit SecG [Mobilitalea sibirica]
MDLLKAIVQIVYIAICIVLTVIVLKQEGKTAGLSGALTGATETYWNKNKGRSKEGWLAKTTMLLAAGFIVLSVVLNLNW